VAERSLPVSERPSANRSKSASRRSLASRRRRALTGAIAILAVVAATVVLARDEGPGSAPGPARGTPAWAQSHYGDPDARGYKRRSIVTIDFLGRIMWVHRGAQRHFLRLERLFEARAPDYAASVAAGEVDDWSYSNRTVSGTSVKSNHSFGLAIDINALANPRGTAGDIPADVASQWEAEGGDWGGDWSVSDPMHFETHLTPEEIRSRYRPDGAPRDWYLQELTGS
jgi:hypothetical protein